MRPARGVGAHQHVSRRVEGADGLDRVHEVAPDGGDLEARGGREDLDAARLLEGADDEGVRVLGVPGVVGLVWFDLIWFDLISGWMD